MSQSWVADRYHVYLWILDVVIFRPDKFCSQVVVRGNVSVHRWSTYLLKQSMIESGYIYIYIVDGASFVLFKYFFRGRQIAFFWSWAVCRSRWAALRGGFWEHSLRSCEILAALKPLLRSASRISTLLLSTTFKRRHSIWDGPGILQAGRGWFWLVVAAVPHLGKSHSSQKSKMPMWMFFLTVCSQENW